MSIKSHKWCLTWRSRRMCLDKLFHFFQIEDTATMDIFQFWPGRIVSHRFHIGYLAPSTVTKQLCFFSGMFCLLNLLDPSSSSAIWKGNCNMKLSPDKSNFGTTENWPCNVESLLSISTRPPMYVSSASPTVAPADGERHGGNAGRHRRAELCQPAAQLVGLLDDNFRLKSAKNLAIYMKLNLFLSFQMII